MAKVTRNTRAEYKAKGQTVRYIYDAGDNRRGMAHQVGAIADDIIHSAVTVTEDGELLEVKTKVSTFWYYLEDFDKSDAAVSE